MPVDLGGWLVGQVAARRSQCLTGCGVAPYDSGRQPLIWRYLVKTVKTLSVMFALSMMVVSGCAATGGAVAGGAAAATGAGAGASLGIKDTLIQVALQAATSYMAGKASGPAQDAAAMATTKEEAAKAGVTAAVDKAKTDGETLTETQQTGLLDMLKSKL